MSIVRDDLGRDAAVLTAEVVAVLVCAMVTLPVPAQIPLLVVAMISMAVRGKRWEDRFGADGFRFLLGAVTGAAALILSLVVVGPLVEARGAMLGWSHHALVRGKPDALVMYVIIVAATSIATELVLRGWILERVRDVSPGKVALVASVGMTALVEAVFTGDTGYSSLGAALFGVALSGLYLATGRSLVAPIAARVTFDVGLLLLEGFKLVD
jgi:membrane protease YdiL (CAAX protease family)